jgi:hypothetical protein
MAASTRQTSDSSSVSHPLPESAASTTEPATRVTRIVSRLHRNPAETRDLRTAVGRITSAGATALVVTVLTWTPQRARPPVPQRTGPPWR